jgi:MSHA pilin protein MshD
MGWHGLRPMTRFIRKTAEQGATLVELIVSIVVISVGLVGVLLVINRNALSSSDPVIQQQTIAIAESYIEEILTKSFTVGPGVTRSTYDDIFDYNGLANNGCTATTAACPTLGSCVCDQTGAPIAGLRGYVVNVQVTNTALDDIAAANAALIRVTVTPPFGNAVTLSGYRTNYN